jgi:hypothetical protein
MYLYEIYVSIIVGTYWCIVAIFIYRWISKYALCILYLRDVVKYCCPNKEIKMTE